MSKYIIELDDRIKLVTSVGVTENGVVYTTSDYVHNLEELNSDYINEHFGSLQDEAYQAGMDKAWEATKKIFGYEIDGAIPIADIGNVFGYEPCKAFCTADILRDFTAPEAIAKLKAYEENQKADDKIEVGDEVEVLNSGSKYLVAWIAGTSLCGFAHDGVTCRLQPSDVRKTGRHFDIKSILEAMKA